MRPKRRRRPALIPLMLPRRITGVTWHWVNVVTPNGRKVQIRDDIPTEQWPELLAAFDRIFPMRGPTTK